MKTIYIIVFFLVLEPFNLVLSGQTPDSCLKLLIYPENSGYYNNDSIKVDSCINSATFGQAFAKVWFAVQFKYNVLPRGDPPTYDSNYEYTWQDIDEGYSLTRDGFQQLEQKFGIFWFQDVHLGFPDTSADTTSEMPWRQLRIRFGSYVNIDSVIVFLQAITYVKWCDYLWDLDLSVPEQSNFEKSNSIIIFPQPANEYINLRLDDVILSKAKDLKICNALGECVMNLTPALSEGEGARIDISALSPGLYFISINNRKETLTGSFIVVR